MSVRNPTDQEIKVYLKRLGNPYASLSVYDTPDEGISKQSADLQKHSYLKELQNPYAYHAVFGEAKVDTEPSRAISPNVYSFVPTTGMSKRDFRARCRRIFLQYTPREEGIQLKPHYREFIDRNEARSAQGRSLVLNELRKYELSSSIDVRPHFNREEEVLTQKKLEQIEKAVDSKK